MFVLTMDIVQIILLLCRVMLSAASKHHFGRQWSSKVQWSSNCNSWSLIVTSRSINYKAS